MDDVVVAIKQYIDTDKEGVTKEYLIGYLMYDFNSVDVSDLEKAVDETLEFLIDLGILVDDNGRLFKTTQIIDEFVESIDLAKRLAKVLGVHEVESSNAEYFKALIISDNLSKIFEDIMKQSKLLNVYIPRDGEDLMNQRSFVLHAINEYEKANSKLELDIVGHFAIEQEEYDLISEYTFEESNKFCMEKTKEILKTLDYIYSKENHDEFVEDIMLCLNEKSTCQRRV